MSTPSTTRHGNTEGGPIAEAMRLPGEDRSLSDHTWTTRGVGLCRFVHSSAVGPLDVQSVVVQRADGTVVTGDGEHQPRIYMGNERNTVAEAVELATMLLDAAQLADMWTGIREPSALPDLDGLTDSQKRVVRYVSSRMGVLAGGDRERQACDAALALAVELVRLGDGVEVNA